MVQNTMMADIYAGISRLTDRSCTKNNDNENITFMILPEMINDESIKKKVEEKIRELNVCTKQIRKARNKYLSHTDLAENIKSSAFLFKGEEVNKSLDLLYDILSIIYCDLLKTNLAKEVIAPLTGAIALMSLLRDGIEHKSRIYKRVESGDYKALEEINRNPI